ncbi:MAG TPA: SufD family Fe-S cluster assembly protein [Desulfuromonadales bacterium]
MNELETLLAALDQSGGDRTLLADRQVAHLVVSGHHILSTRTIEGLEVDAAETDDGIRARVVVREGVRIEQPVYLCFGVVHRQEIQRIGMDVRLRNGASAHFLAHCLFPDAREVRHLMEAAVTVGEGAELRYSEDHFHGPHGGIEVVPRASIQVERNGRYYADFSLLNGRVGRLAIDYTVEGGENSVTELTARVHGRGSDRIDIREQVILAGAGARGLIKTRIVLQDDAAAEVTGITEGNAAGARGHVDCLELVKDRAVARAVPIVNVTHPLAKVTHEAAIGSVDQRQLETLMAHGLTPEEAVDVIVRGILK